PFRTILHRDTSAAEAERGQSDPAAPWGGLIGFLLIRAATFVNRISIKCEIEMITTRQVKAARALLGWSQADLAAHSGISEPTVARLESRDGELGGRERTAQKIQRAIVTAGVEFLDENGGGLGVRLRKRQRSKK